MKAGTRRALAEPYFLALVFAGLGLGSLPLVQSARLAIMWAALALFGLAYLTHEDLEFTFELAPMGRGAMLGLVVSLPVLVFLSGELRVFTERLYGTTSAVSLFYQACFVAGPSEALFFRGVVQQAKGSSVSIGLYAAAALLMYVPHSPLFVGLIMFVVMGVLGIVYSYVQERYGLAAAVVCQIVVVFVLQVLPSLFDALRYVAG